MSRMNAPSDWPPEPIPICRICGLPQNICEVGVCPSNTATPYVDMVQSVMRSEDHPETAVINSIDALIDEQIAAGDQSRAWMEPLPENCPRCGGEWHGLPRFDHRGKLMCSGSFSEGDEDESPMASEQWPPDDPGSDLVPVVGGPAVLTGVPIWQAFEYQPSIGPMVESLFAPLGLMQELVDTVLSMLAEICGIRLAHNDVEGCIQSIREMIEAHRSERERRERIRQSLLTYDAAPVPGYTLRDVDEMRREIASARNRQTLQGLRRHRRADRQANTQAGACNDGRRELSAGTAMCDPSSCGEESAEGSGT
jgi:hypothetical protein